MHYGNPGFTQAPWFEEQRGAQHAAQSHAYALLWPPSQLGSCQPGVCCAVIARMRKSQQLDQAARRVSRHGLELTCGCTHVAISYPVMAFHSLHVKSAEPVAARSAGVLRQHDQTQAVCTNTSYPHGVQHLAAVGARVPEWVLGVSIVRRLFQLMLDHPGLHEARCTFLVRLPGSLRLYTCLTSGGLRLYTCPRFSS
jgi:hypothetical protein